MNFSQNFEQSNWANSVHADEVSSSDYKRLFSLLEAIYAEAVACEVGKLTKERYCGCEYDHPSQLQHDCIMLSEQERWQSYGLEAIERVIDNGSNPTLARHIFQACPVWIYTQSNITQVSYSPEYITPTQQNSIIVK